ncbi:MAG: N4-gp56 family major capsid protein [Desulfobacteraceae bacterium]|nr:N4-gp56 family major capsid protein [Desulfobacteraceae bacterium]
MTDTTAAAGLVVQQWDAKFYREYLVDNQFSVYMGTGEMEMIQVKEDLTKKKGDTITFALVNRLTNDPVTGSGTLEGNEEDMTSRSHTLTIDKRRNAVRVAEIEEQQSAIPLRNAARPVLLDWAMEDTRDLVIDALSMVNGVNYSDASEAQKDAWQVDNSDRILYGSAITNLSGDSSADLAKIQASGGTISAARLSVMKRMAINGSPKIRPIRVAGDRRFYVGFCDSRVFRDLKSDSTITQAQREVTLQSQNNRLFQGGDLIYDGMLIREVPDIPVLAGSGAASADVGRLFLCGAQAIAMGWAKRWNTVTEAFDYGDKQGVAVDGMYHINKMTFGTDASVDTTDQKDHGIVTGFFAAAADD